jgi:hypothetical protein
MTVRTTVGLTVFLLLVLLLSGSLLVIWNAQRSFLSGRPLFSFGLSFFTNGSRFDSYRRRDAPDGEGDGSAVEQRRSLVDIAGSHSTSFWKRLVMPPDSALLPTDKNSGRGYLEVYEPLLEPLRERGDVRVLEIGVYRGGSLVLWREFFSAGSHVYGLDVVQSVPRFPSDDHIHVAIADSTKREDARAVFPEVTAFDVVVDDGCHDIDAQLATAAGFFPRLARPGCVYVVEDAGSHGEDLARRLAASTGVDWWTAGEIVYHAPAPLGSGAAS